jgi:hypothetical protein
MVRKELHLEKSVLQILEKEAKRQNRSLKNYLEFLAQQQAKKLELPSRAYREEMDTLLAKVEEGTMRFSSLEEVMDRNGISD